MARSTAKAKRQKRGAQKRTASPTKTGRRSKIVRPRLISFAAHCVNPECAAPELGTHPNAAAASTAASRHATASPGHLTMVGTNRWDAKCFTHPLNLAEGTSAGSALQTANVHLRDFPDHDVQVWEE